MRSRQVYVDKIMSWLGCHEGDSTHKYIIDTYNNHKPLAQNYKVKYTDPWCATTVSAAAIECGYTDIIPTECSCNRMIALAQKMGIWQENDAYVPKKGDIVLYDWQDNGVGDNKGVPDHVGVVVYDAKDGKFQVVEGNKNDGVNLRNMSVNGKYIRGFICPQFDDKAVESKPAAKKTVGGSPRPPKKYQWGIDVSEYQGVIDWDKVKDAGIQFVVIRSIKKNLSADPYFEKNLNGCINHKIDYSCYKLSSALTIAQAKAEAQAVIKLLNGRKMLIWLDLEDNTQCKLGKAGIQNIALAFMEECEKAGYHVGIYCNLVWYKNYISDYLKQNVAFWIARYKKDDKGVFDESQKPSGIKNMFAWQYSSKGSIPGIKGNVDLDVIV